MIHCIGVYQKHKRTDINSAETIEKEKEVNDIKKTEEIPKDSIPAEYREFVWKIERKHDYFLSKASECDIVIKSYHDVEKEIENNYEATIRNLRQGISFIQKLVENKENELVSELKIMKDQKMQKLHDAENKLTDAKKHINQVCDILQQGISMPEFAVETGENYISKRMDLWEDEISAELLNRQSLNTSMPKLMDLAPLNQLLSTITFNQLNPLPPKILDDAELDKMVLEIQDQTNDSIEAPSSQTNTSYAKNIINTSTSSMPNESHILRKHNSK